MVEVGPINGAQAGEIDLPRPENTHRGVVVQDLSKTYVRIVGREIIRTDALIDVSLEVRPEEFVSLIGPSGCGKTTVLKVLAGLTSPSAGKVLIGGQPVRGPGTDRATVFQQAGLMPWRNVMGNVMLALEFARVPKDERQSRAETYLRMVGLGDFSDHYPAELSGGMQQRVGIARALALEPEVLLMDEPFGALDAITRHTMQNELLRIWSQKRKSVLFVTHSIEEAILLSDQIVIMKEGAVAEVVSVPIDRPRARAELIEDPVARDLTQHLESLL